MSLGKTEVEYISNLAAIEVKEHEVEKFDGLEYKMKGKGEDENIGMGQGYTVQPNGFIIYANGEPMLRITKR